MLTGTLPHEHGVHTHDPDFAMLRRDETISGTLSSHRSVCVSANEFASEQFGFDTSFDQFVPVSHTRRFPEGMDATDGGGPVEFLRHIVRHDAPAASVTNYVLGKLFWATDGLPVPGLFDQGARSIAKRGADVLGETAEPFFAFVNVMDAHLPHHVTVGYDADLHSVPMRWSSGRFDHWEINRGGEDALAEHAADVRNFRESYAASIDYLDRQVTNFITRVAAATDRETTFVITADHGENLGYPADEYLFAHTSSLSEGLLHVPLCVVNVPGDASARPPESGPSYVSHLGLPELVVGLANGELPELTAPRVPAELIGGGTITKGDSEYWDRMIRCVYDAETNRKFVWDSLGERSEHELDPERACWQSTVGEADEVPDWAEDFFGVGITEYKSAAAGEETELSDAVDAGTRGRRADLGYL
jgi:hypothetical protein